MNGQRDDRVLWTTRLLGAVIVPFLVVAFIGLYLFPGATGRWFAWKIRPDMTPLVMASGYLAGAYFFIRVVLARSWHRVHLGFMPITAFTLFMAIATLSHLDRFDHDHATFWIWTGLYLTTPVLVPIAWWRNRATDPGTLEPGGDFLLPRPARAALLAAAAAQIAVAAVLLVSPSTMIAIWPWRLTPLTAQVLGGWFALPGVVALMMGIDGRWSAIRVTLQSQVLGLVFILLGVALARGDFDASNALTYVFGGGLGLLLVSLLALDLWASRLQRRAAGQAA